MSKAVSLLLLALVCSGASFAQLITTTPTFPRDTSSISITVDCTKGNQGLLNYANTNDVYVHIGVITNLSTNSSDWKYVKTAWATTDPIVKATYLGNNKYRYTVSNPRTFFGVPAGEAILKIAILFRNGAGTAVQRTSDPNVDQGNMYVPIYTAALAGKFIDPPLEARFNPIPEPINKAIGDSVRITWFSNNAADLKIFFNGVQTNAVSSSTAILDTVLITSAGSQQIVARATEGAVTISDTITFFIAPATNVLPQPAGTRDGINYQQGDTSVILVLFAPNKARVSVIGDFNNWIETPAFQMNQTPDGQRYWLRITGLTPGDEYAYQYLVNSGLRIADPYTNKVLDPANDPFISATTYPNLKAYPTGKTSGIVSVLQTAKPAYTWQINNFTRPDKRSIVAYELLLRDFVATHDWKTLKDTLTYLKALGINAIELMPFNEFEGNVSWGYNPSFYFAADKYYGPENTLKAFIDEAHKQGIAIVMDIALNHSFGQSPMVQLYFDAVNNRPALDNPWFNPTTRHAFNVGYDMNHESVATKAYFSRVVEYWLTEFKIDGFRFDLSKGFTQKNTCDPSGNNCNVDNWGVYDASRVAIWKGYYDTVQLKSPGSYAILEHFAANDEEKELSDYGMLFWGNLNYNFSEAAMGYVSNSNFDNALHTTRGWNQPNLMSYMESHDEERLMYKNINFGAVSGSYNVKDISTGLKRNEMATAFLLMMPGPKMIWQFGEMGYDYSINACENGTISNDCRLSPKPIRWDYLQDQRRLKLHDVTAGLLKIRSHPLFKNGFVTNRVERSLTSAIKWLKLTTDTSNILVVGNFDVTPGTASVTFQNAGTWYDYFTGATIAATGAIQNIALQPGEYHVYVNRNITSIVSPVTDVIYDGKKISLSVFPNPVKRNGTIEYELPESGRVTLRLINLSGQQVGNIHSAFEVKGVHRISVDKINRFANLPRGTYFLQMDFGQRKLVQKLVLDF
ncbi:MAG: T9SS type A sorting domain-containing protein [Chitinophagaceae bacterium]|nr:T9SS type A sorting domain-containing protein [Chitinophagaceae bacterium]